MDFDYNNYNNKEHLVLILTNQCSEKCPYCVLNFNKLLNEDRIKFNPKFIEMRLNKHNLNDFEYISLMGGELGLIDKDQFDILYDYILNTGFDERKIWIYTNGLFLERYAKYYPNCRYIYHIISPEKFKIFNYNNIDNLYILDRIKSIDEIELLLQKYNHINFFIVVDVNVQRIKITDIFLNKLRNLLNDHSNIRLMADRLYNKDVIQNALKDTKHFNIFCSLFRNNSLSGSTDINLF